MAKAGLQLDTRQRLSLAPGLATGMDILALPLASLVERIERASLDNPFLVVETGGSFGPVDGLDLASGSVADEPRLADHLRVQLAGQRLDPDIAALAALLADDLDARGYLPECDVEIAALHGATERQVAAARAALQSCEPTGVAARDLADCLRLQLMDDGMAPDFAARVCGELPALATARYAAAAAHLGVTVDEAEALAARLATLWPEPAARIDAAQPVPLVPELEVTLGEDGRPRLDPIDDGLPRVALDADLIRRAISGDRAAAARGFVTVHRLEGQRLINAIGFRRRTLARVGAALVEHQASYFLGQSTHPRPLSRADMAAQLGLHPATVGRAVQGSALRFEGRTIPLAWLFPAAVRQAVGPGLAPVEIHSRIREILAREVSDCVLSDEEIAEKLRDLGVDIARRTVAKYRKCLQIPSKSQRRRLLALRERKLSAARLSARPI